MAVAAAPTCGRSFIYLLIYFHAVASRNERSVVVTVLRVRRTSGRKGIRSAVGGIPWRNARQKVAGADEVDKGCAGEDDVIVPIGGEVLDGRAGAEPLGGRHRWEPGAVAEHFGGFGAVGRGAVGVCPAVHIGSSGSSRVDSLGALRERCMRDVHQRQAGRQAGSVSATAGDCRLQQRFYLPTRAS
jgi:hypothetical protein